MIKTLENIKLHSQKFVGVELHNFRWVVEEGHVNQFKNSLKVQGVDFISKDKMPIAYSITSSHWGTPHLEVLQNLMAKSLPHSQKMMGFLPMNFLRLKR